MVAVFKQELLYAITALSEIIDQAETALKNETNQRTLTALKNKLNHRIKNIESCRLQLPEDLIEDYTTALPLLNKAADLLDEIHELQSNLYDTASVAFDTSSVISQEKYEPTFHSSTMPKQEHIRHQSSFLQLSSTRSPSFSHQLNPASSSFPQPPINLQEHQFVNPSISFQPAMQYLYQGHGNLPRKKIPIFTGDETTYLDWKESFTLKVDSLPIPATEKFGYLKDYINGPASERHL